MKMEMPQKSSALAASASKLALRSAERDLDYSSNCLSYSPPFPSPTPTTIVAQAADTTWSGAQRTCNACLQHVNLWKIEIPISSAG